jgi:hypothetical protein
MAPTHSAAGGAVHHVSMVAEYVDLEVRDNFRQFGFGGWGW